MLSHLPSRLYPCGVLRLIDETRLPERAWTFQPLRKITPAKENRNISRQNTHFNMQSTWTVSVCGHTGTWHDAYTGWSCRRCSICRMKCIGCFSNKASIFCTSSSCCSRTYIDRFQRCERMGLLKCCCYYCNALFLASGELPSSTISSGIRRNSQTTHKPLSHGGHLVGCAVHA